MSYCAICGREHDQDLPCACFSGTSQVLRAAGMKDGRQRPDTDYRRLARLADRWFMRLLLAFLAVVATVYILSVILRRTSW